MRLVTDGQNGSRSILKGGDQICEWMVGLITAKDSHLLFFKQ